MRRKREGRGGGEGGGREGEWGLGEEGVEGRGVDGNGGPWGGGIWPGFWLCLEIARWNFSKKNGAKSVQDSKLRGVPVGLARHDFHAWKPISVF